MLKEKLIKKAYSNRGNKEKRKKTKVEAILLISEHFVVLIRSDFDIETSFDKFTVSEVTGAFFCTKSL